jgi:peptide/nickel transport system substrate-binding protein
MAMIDSDAVQAFGNVSNWHNAIGTGPYEVSDFVDSSSATLVKNLNYWGHDERYPQNQLPYINQINFLIIPSAATALAAFRAGKIDVIEQQSMTSAQQMKQTNPNIIQIPILQPGNGITINVSNAPYNNLQVREALQMAINLPQLASTYKSCDVEHQFINRMDIPLQSVASKPEGRICLQYNAGETASSSGGLPQRF